jgi:N-carbamoylputrescine amidase
MICQVSREENLRMQAAIVEAERAGSSFDMSSGNFLFHLFLPAGRSSLFLSSRTSFRLYNRLFFTMSKTLDSVLVVPLFERIRRENIYSLVVINPDGSIAGRYRKMHIPNDPQFQEKYYFTPGDLGFQAIQTAVGKIGSMICWDQWYPEAARLCALDGAGVLIYPTAIGWLPGEKEGVGAMYLDSWKTIQRGHSIANGIYTVSVNRVGIEPNQAGDSEIEFWGHSFIVDPRGHIIAEASGEEEEILYGSIEPQLIPATRQTWPFFRDRRTDAYDKLAE